ncbi:MULTISPECIES: hypothetical protein [unclassified Schlesneria]|uniref:hypothetical protein n=1 Tax=Schlesneria TaxID=656899 RepID=UPI002EE11665
MLLKLLQDQQFIPLGVMVGMTGLGLGVIWKRFQYRTRQRVRAAVAAYLALQQSERTV